MSSIATVTGCPAGTSSATTSRATARPSSSEFQRAREKNECARLWLHNLDRPVPASIPHPVRLPVCPVNPQARPQNVRIDVAVNNGAKQTSSAWSEAGNRERGVRQHRRDSVSSAVSQAPLMLPSSRPHLRQLRVPPGHAACRIRPCATCTPAPDSAIAKTSKVGFTSS